MHWRLLLIAAFTVACQRVGSRLCSPCDLDTCTGALQCIENVCVPPDAPDFCPNYVPPPSCGEGPPCAEGLECFEGACEAPLDVQLGWNHACVLWRSGSVECWGTNRYGQAGGFDEQFLPVAERVRELDGAVDLAVGIDFSCALREGGDAYCWGQDYRGKLGNFGAGGPAPHAGPVPQRVSLPGPARRIYATEHSACALLEDESLACWGWNLHGCLPVAGDASNLPAVVVPRASEDLAMGESHVVWIDDGRLYGIGRNESGQLGVPATCAPVDLGFDDATHVAAGALHTCVVLEGTRVRCFGTTSGISTYDHDRPIDRLVASRWNTCLTDEDDRTFCWGKDGFGVLGTLDHFEAPSGPDAPLRVGFADDARISFGNNFACMIRDHEGASCWGRPDWGYIGNGTGARREPTVVTSERFVELDSGSGHSCGRTAEGAVVCWGENVSGQLGRGYRSLAEDAGRIEGIAAEALAVGGATTCLIDERGRVWCTGALYFPRPSETVVDSSVPTELAGVPLAKDISIGAATMCILTRDDEVFCLGDNSARQAVPTAGARFIAEPTRVPEAAGAVEIAIGAGTTCARFADDRVVCWGDLGVRGGPEELGGPDGMVLEGVRNVHVGAGNVHLRMADGRVLAGGYNEGRLGDGQAARPIGLVDVVGGQDIAHVDAYASHACMIGRNGALSCWGTFPVTEDPIDVALKPISMLRDLGPIELVSTGHWTTCAQPASDDVRCWGHGYSLGADTATYRQPVRVVGLTGRGSVDGP